MSSNEALLDASAFLELEKALPSKDIDGIEAAIAASEVPPSQTLSQVNMRINKASLDKIAAAAKTGSLKAFGDNRDQLILAMDELRKHQEHIFDIHMRFDVFDSEEENPDFSSKEFLSTFQATHESKEKSMEAITQALGTLAQKISEVNTSLDSNSIPGDPLEKPVTPPKMTLKSVATRVVETKRIGREKMQATLKYAVEDAVLLDKLTHGVVPQNKTPTPTHELTHNKTFTPSTQTADNKGKELEKR